MTRPFDGAYFNHSLFLVLCNRLATICVATLTLIGQQGTTRPVAPLTSYAAVSLANVAATTCQYEALKYVSFGAQTLAKCLKPVPVMAWGALWLGRRYSVADVVVTAAVMAGCWLFMGGGVVAPRAAFENSSSIVAHVAGTGLLSAYLAADGLTSTLQDRMFDRATMSPANQVLYVALFSCAVSVAGLVVGGVAGGHTHMLAAVSFCINHPACALWIAALALSATASSFFITTTVQHYGALVLSLAMTVRQLASVVISSFTYGHDLSAREACGAAVVFGALFLKAAARLQARWASASCRTTAVVGDVKGTSP